MRRALLKSGLRVVLDPRRNLKIEHTILFFGLFARLFWRMTPVEVCSCGACSTNTSISSGYIGAANVDSLWHMVFRVPDSPAVMALREEIAELEYCHTDQALFDLAIAASYNGKEDWLTNHIETEQAATPTWKRKRGVVLAGFTSNNALPVADAWPDGEIQTNYADLATTSARYMWIEACARHWWQVYLKASNPAEAYAAWALFLRSADRRAWIWVQQDIETARGLKRLLQAKDDSFSA